MRDGGGRSVDGFGILSGISTKFRSLINGRFMTEVLYILAIGIPKLGARMISGGGDIRREGVPAEHQ